MKVLIWGDRTRYERDLPDSISSLPLELVYCPREQPLTAALPEHSDAQVLFVDAIAPVDRPLMNRLPELKLIHSEGVAYNTIDLQV